MANPFSRTGGGQVIRGGARMSVVQIQPGDIVLKRVGGGRGTFDFPKSGSGSFRAGDLPRDFPVEPVSPKPVLPELKRGVKESAEAFSKRKESYDVFAESTRLGLAKRQEEIIAISVKPTEAQKLTPQVGAVVSAAKPFTAEDIESHKKFEFEYQAGARTKAGREAVLTGINLVAQPVEAIIDIPQQIAGRRTLVTHAEIWAEPKKGERPEVTLGRKRVTEEIIPTWKFEQDLKQKADIIYSKAQAKVTERAKKTKNLTQSKADKIVAEESARASAEYKKYSNKQLEQFKGDA